MSYQLHNIIEFTRFLGKNTKMYFPDQSSILFYNRYIVCLYKNNKLIWTEKMPSNHIKSFKMSSNCKYFAFLNTFADTINISKVENGEPVRHINKVSNGSYVVTSFEFIDNYIVYFKQKEDSDGCLLHRLDIEVENDYTLDSDILFNAIYRIDNNRILLLPHESEKQDICYILNIKTMKSLDTYEIKNINEVAFTRDGSIMSIYDENDSTIYMYDTVKFEKLDKYQIKDDITDYKLSDNNILGYTNIEDQLKLINLSNKSLMQEFDDLKNFYFSFGRLILVTSNNFSIYLNIEEMFGDVKNSAK